MNSRIRNRILLLFAVSLVALCLLACGCTSQSESADIASQDQAVITAAPPSGGGPGMGKPEMGAEEFNPADVPPANVSRTGCPEFTGNSGGGRGGTDFASAAKTLGVTEDQLIAVLGGMGAGSDMDLDAAASELGVTAEDLKEVLGPQGDMPPGGRQAPE